MKIKFSDKKEMTAFITAELNGPYIADKIALTVETNEKKAVSTIEFYGGKIL